MDSNDFRPAQLVKILAGILVFTLTGLAINGIVTSRENLKDSYRRKMEIRISLLKEEYARKIDNYERKQNDLENSLKKKKFHSAYLEEEVNNCKKHLYDLEKKYSLMKSTDEEDVQVKIIEEIEKKINKLDGDVTKDDVINILNNLVRLKKNEKNYQREDEPDYYGQASAIQRPKPP